MEPTDTSPPAAATDERQDGARFEPVPANGLCARLGDKWTLQVVARLARADGRSRFSAIRRDIEGITQRMLTLTLRNLERDGLVARHVHAEVPSRVEYALTPVGAGMVAALAGIHHWVRDNLPHIEASRRAYDGDGQPRADR